jgi:hypothetical protein
VQCCIRTELDRNQCSFFDGHVHLPSPGINFVWEWQPFTTDVPAALHYLRRCGVERIVVNTVRGETAKTAAEMVAGNAEIAELADKAIGGDVLGVPGSGSFGHGSGIFEGSILRNFDFSL